jgi:hypothetical protein
MITQKECGTDRSLRDGRSPHGTLHPESGRKERDLDVQNGHSRRCGHRDSQGHHRISRQDQGTLTAVEYPVEGEFTATRAK